MKHFRSKISAFLLATIVFFSTTSLGMNMHFCCDELVDTSIFTNVETCGMKDMGSDSKKCSLEESAECCDTKTFTKNGHDDLYRVSFDLDHNTIVFLQSFVITYINLFEGLQENIVPFIHHKPPLISKDIIVLHETYLI